MAFFLSAIALSGIFVQDLKYRAIHWIWLAMLSFVSLQYSTLPFPLKFINIIIVLIQVLVVWIYFSWKSKGKIYLFRDYFGIGDLLFLCAICGFFTPKIFLSFLIISLLISLAPSLILKPKSDDQTVPLAGYMAAQLFVLMPANWLFNSGLLSLKW